MYVFYIHSHITFVIASFYIYKNKLDKNKVRFITSRLYKVDDSSKTFDITSFYNYLEKESKLLKFLNLKSKIRELDKLISQFVNYENFTVFVPQFNHSIFQILATHPLCNASVLMEEGITSYKKDKALYSSINNSITYVMSKIFSKRFIVNNSHYYPYPEDKFKFAISINESCFPYISNRKILKLNKQIVTDYSNILKNNSRIFLLDSFKERIGLSEDKYITIVKETLQLLKEHKGVLFVKFHPEQSEAIRKKTHKFIEYNFNYDSVVRINDESILEFEFLKLKGLTVIGMHTSLLFYANNFGHRVISSLKLTSRIPEINAYINHIMDEDQKKIFLNYE